LAHVGITLFCHILALKLDAGVRLPVDGGAVLAERGHALAQATTEVLPLLFVTFCFGAAVAVRDPMFGSTNTPSIQVSIIFYNLTASSRSTQPPSILAVITIARIAGPDAAHEQRPVIMGVAVHVCTTLQRYTGSGIRVTAVVHNAGGEALKSCIPAFLRILARICSVVAIIWICAIEIRG